MKEETTVKIEDWQSLINKSVYGSDGKEIGVISEIQPLHLIVTFGVMTPDKFNIPKTLIKNKDKGIVYLKKDSKFIKDNHAFQ
jgi:sporulation protein YlmC with PRC-barrel domain